MEEEYRMQKTQSDIRQVLSATSANRFSVPPGSSDLGNAVIHEDGTVVSPSIDDQASTRGMAPSPTIQPVADADDIDDGPDDGPVSAIPTIRISTESSPGNDTEEENEQKKPVDDKGKEKEEKEEAEGSELESKETGDRKKEKGKGKEVYVEGQETSQDMPLANGVIQQNGVQKHDLERPVQAAGEGDQNMNEASPAPAQEPFSFSNKRLCERWLDNLFMVLYEVGYPSFLDVSQVIQQ
jgi:Chs5-Arf1p-binding protein BUD7/BCH1